jgi:hypothetical protein
MRFVCGFLQKPNPYGPKGLQHKIFEIRRSNFKHFCVDSVCAKNHFPVGKDKAKFVSSYDKIRFAHAEHTIYEKIN